MGINDLLSGAIGRSWVDSGCGVRIAYAENATDLMMINLVEPVYLINHSVAANSCRSCIAVKSYNFFS